jgi:hypothetical protein
MAGQALRQRRQAPAVVEQGFQPQWGRSSGEEPHNIIEALEGCHRDRPGVLISTMQIV